MELRTSAEISTMDLAKIQAQILIPLARALRKEIGDARAREILRDAIAEAHRERIRDEAARLDGTPLEKFRTMMNRAAASNGPQLDFEVLEMDQETVRFNVNGCRYAELFRALGEPELGAMLLCDGDDYVAEVAGESVEFTRTQTLMRGGSHFDFCYRIRPGRERGSP